MRGNGGGWMSGNGGRTVEDREEGLMNGIIGGGTRKVGGEGGVEGRMKT